MALADDILAKIRQDFSADEMPSIIEMLNELQKENTSLFNDRILRCIIFVADGRFESFADAVKLARIDWRDLIVNAEYDGQFGARQRDLSLPFGA
jgi:hypothetical protein